MPKLAGTYSVTGTLKGPAALPRMELDVTGTSISYDGELLGDVRSYVKLTEQADPFVQEALRWSSGQPPAHEKCPHAREGLARAHWPEDPPMHTVEGLMPSLDMPMAFITCGSGLKGRLAFDMAIGRTLM